MTTVTTATTVTTVTSSKTVATVTSVSTVTTVTTVTTATTVRTATTLVDSVSEYFNPFTPGDFAEKSVFKVLEWFFWPLSCYKEIKLTTNRFTPHGLLI